MITKKQEENWKYIIEISKQYSTMSKPEYVAIINIITDANNENKTLTFKQLCKSLHNKYGSQVSENQIRYYINKLESNAIILKIIKKNKIEIKLNSNFKVNNFIPKKQIQLFTITAFISTLTIAWNFFFQITSKTTEGAILLIIFMGIILFTNYLDYNYKISYYKNYLIENINKLRLYLHI